MIARFLFLLVIVGSSTAVLAQQTRAQLQAQQKSIQSELKEIENMYSQLQGETKKSLSQLNMVKRKVSLQEQYIANINKDLKLLDDNIYLSNLEIYRLKNQVDTLKTQYAKTIVYAYKNRSSYSYINFIFSASSFNDVIRRIAYLKSYRDYREKQIATIRETQALIQKRQQEQVTRQQDQKDALEGRTKEREVLAEQQKEKNQVVASLRSEGAALQKQITDRKKKNQEVTNKINALIREEIAAAKRAEDARIAAEKKKEEERQTALRKAKEEKDAADRAAALVAKKATDDAAAANKNTNTAAVSVPEKKTETVAPPAVKEAVSTVAATPVKEEKKFTSYLETSANSAALGASFADNKGKLPWPLDKGVVTVPFGNYSIDGDGFRDIKAYNAGITIATDKKANVKAVFDGQVLGVITNAGISAVIIQHGKYISSYTNLGTITVSKGAMVKTGQVIGTAGTSDDGLTGEILFMLNVDAQGEVNPEPWLRRR